MTFEINEKQKKAIDKWLRSLHRSKKPYYGRDVHYIFQNTGIGVSLDVKDLKTGKVKDFTDYDTW